MLKKKKKINHMKNHVKEKAENPAQDNYNNVYNEWATDSRVQWLEYYDWLNSE